ncbi:MAG: hypothetical protein KBC41_04000 [Candidatus Pacebacteria bacterium]|nr:hypothetical protein [Candidatus Paceibacterota bacterium]MBP9867207.1 hypothetical protein [Candidatus Paceibacterota bacterium]
MNTEIKTKAIDVLLYIGVGISLVWSVVNFITIIFTAIDRKFVDVLNAQTYVDMYNSDVRFAIASLVVIFPVYVGLSWYISKDISKFPYKQDLTIRKVMTYLTLFVTVCTLIGTLVSIIYTYLGGEISVRFGLKALTIFIVSLSLFSYYVYLVRREYTKKTYIPMIFAVVSSSVVLVSIVWSITIIGTPKEMRAKKIDSTRLSDLSRLQQEILNRFQETGKIPESLSELNNAFRGFTALQDPVTKKEYGYKVVQQSMFAKNITQDKKVVTTPAIFELCATFDIVRNLDERGQAFTGNTVNVLDVSSAKYSPTNYYYEGDMTPFWNHDVGEACFKRVIPTEMYYGR